MPIFHYHTIDAAGKKRKGVIEAETAKEAKENLREQGSMVISLTEKKRISSKQNLKGVNLVSFTMQLSQMVNAGVPLYESLLALEEQYRNESYHPVLHSLCEKIKSGSSLSEAMASYPESFDRLYRAMVAAGESAGALDVVLERLSAHLTKQDKLKKQIVTALIYPAVLGGFALAVITLLLGFVVPSIEGIFADRQLNGFTAFILKLSHVFRDYWWAYIPLIGGLLAFAVMKLRSPKGKLWIERYSLKMPLIRTLVTQAAIARFTRTMGTLQQGGLPMIDSLRISQEVMHNIVLEGEVKKAELKIIEGSSLSAELKKSPYFPLMVTRMLAVGEDSGTLTVMLQKIADIYEDDLEKTLNRLMALAQPAILIVMGAIIGTVLLAILLPLTDVSSFIT